MFRYTLLRVLKRFLKERLDLKNELRQLKCLSKMFRCVFVMVLKTFLKEKPDLQNELKDIFWYMNQVKQPLYERGTTPFSTINQLIQ